MAQRMEELEVQIRTVGTTTDADRQIAYSREKLPYGPPLKAAAEGMPAEMAAELPVGENMATAFVTGTPEDVEFWLDNLDEITERWNTWKVKN